jgi:hypothetical protein
LKSEAPSSSRCTFIVIALKFLRGLSGDLAAGRNLKKANISRKERRQEQRKQGKLKKQREKELAKVPKVSLFHALLKRAWSKFWALILAGLGLVGGYRSFRPHVSIEPQIVLNPVDPYTTQFNIKNENALFDIYNVNAVCWPQNMQSGNGFSIVSIAPLQNVHHQIPLLEPGASSTVDCPPAIGGLGSYSGVVANAELEILVSYKQSWWPFSREERYPFASKRDVQGAVHWLHTTPYEEKPFSEIFGKHN